MESYTKPARKKGGLDIAIDLPAKPSLASLRAGFFIEAGIALGSCQNE